MCGDASAPDARRPSSSTHLPSMTSITPQSLAAMVVRSWYATTRPGCSVIGRGHGARAQDLVSLAEDRQRIDRRMHATCPSPGRACIPRKIACANSIRVTRRPLRALNCCWSLSRRRDPGAPRLPTHCRRYRWVCPLNCWSDARCCRSGTARRGGFNLVQEPRRGRSASISLTAGASWLSSDLLITKTGTIPKAVGYQSACAACPRRRTSSPGGNPVPPSRSRPSRRRRRGAEGDRRCRGCA